MKLCFLAPGNSIHSYRWIKHFADKGHEIHWISINPLAFPDGCGAHYYEVGRHPLNGFRLLRAALGARRLIKKIRPDVLQVHSVGIYGVLGVLSGWHPLLEHAWGSDVLFTKESFLKRPVLKYILNKADILTCDAKHMAHTMAALGASSDKIHLIFYNATDTRQFCPGPRDAELACRLGVANSPVVISLRNFFPVYNIESFIEAMPIVLREIPRVKFLLAGDGPQADELKEMTRRLGVWDSVRFLGMLPYGELPRHLRLADAYVSTSLSDAGLAASTVEAMACGLAVVVTDLLDSREWVFDGENGFLAPPGDPQALALRLIMLLKDSDLRARLGSQARKLMVEKKNYALEMGKMETFYEKFSRASAWTLGKN